MSVGGTHRSCQDAVCVTFRLALLFRYYIDLQKQFKVPSHIVESAWCRAGLQADNAWILRIVIAKRALRYDLLTFFAAIKIETIITSDFHRRLIQTKASAIFPGPDVIELFVWQGSEQRNIAQVNGGWVGK